MHLQKHQRVRRVTGNGNHNLSYAGRDLQLQETYLKVLLGNSSRSSSTNASSTVTDSLLPSLVLNLSSPEVEDASKFSAPAVVENNWFKRSLPSKTWKLRYDPFVLLSRTIINLLGLVLFLFVWFLFDVR